MDEMFVVLFHRDYGDGASTSVSSLHRTRDGAVRAIEADLGPEQRAAFSPDDSRTWRLDNFSWFDIEAMTVEE